MNQRVELVESLLAQFMYFQIMWSLPSLLVRSMLCRSGQLAAVTRASSIGLQPAKSYSSEKKAALFRAEFNSEPNPEAGSPVIVAHGMLGSSANWTSICKALHKHTGRRVISYDAINHGQSPHTSEAVNYDRMSDDLIDMISELNIQPVTLLGHSMGGRTAMWTALRRPDLIDSLVIVDVSPCPAKIENYEKSLIENRQYQVDAEREWLKENKPEEYKKWYGTEALDSSDWDMSHFFHAMLGVQFPQDVNLSEARREADRQLSLRIQDPNLRAWLLMNMGVIDESTGRIGWKNNVKGILNSFEQYIAYFPDATGKQCVQPTLFIGGSDSNYLPVTDHIEIYEYFPDSFFRYINGAGHWVHADKPQEFLRLVVKFLHSREV